MINLTPEQSLHIRDTLLTVVCHYKDDAYISMGDTVGAVYMTP